MINFEWLDNRIAYSRLRYTGRDPFGPWADLNDIYLSLSSTEDQKCFIEYLKPLLNDDFWKEFITLFFDEHHIK